MPFKRILLPLLTLFFALSLTVSGAATTYNPYTQYSTATNPNGVWSYGYGSVGSGPITLYTQIFGQSWGYNGDPIIGNSTGIYGGVNVPVGDLVMHPGDAETLATILVFTAPTAGTYFLSGLFERDNTNNGAGNGVAVHICQDTTNCTLYSNFISPSNYLNQAAFNLSRTLAAGETLDFEVARTGGSYNYDTTGLQLNITTAGIATTPEPSSLVLIGTGIIGIFGALKRRLPNTIS